MIRFPQAALASECVTLMVEPLENFHDLPGLTGVEIPRALVTKYLKLGGTDSWK
jgi:hypothetical protein